MLKANMDLGQPSFLLRLTEDRYRDGFKPGLRNARFPWSGTTYIEHSQSEDGHRQPGLCNYDDRIDCKKRKR
jgi:hypothetical protein